ncbi:MAG: hypothetical protein JWQ40_4647 [Segetibacter sp.]|nr:hypothetical protein [Segetibacter sp.]
MNQFSECVVGNTAYTANWKTISFIGLRYCVHQQLYLKFIPVKKMKDNQNLKYSRSCIISITEITK